MNSPSSSHGVLKSYVAAKYDDVVHRDHNQKASFFHDMSKKKIVTILIWQESETMLSYLRPFFVAGGLFIYFSMWD